MAFGAVYGPPFVREGDVRREGTIEDFRNFARLAQSFAALDSAGGVVNEPNDTPLDSRHLDMVYALQTLTDKLYMGNVVSGVNARDTIAMTEILFGSREADRGDAGADLADQLQLAAALGRPDARGAVRVHRRQPAGHADAVHPDGRDVAGDDPGRARAADRRGAVGHRAVAADPARRPVVFGSFLSNIDMQSGSPTFGTPESGIGLLCTGQIARHFNLPFRTGGGLTSSQVPDAQAGYEALMTMLPTFLAGANWVMHSAGWLEGGLVAGFEKFIIDIELVQMLQHEFTPLEIDEDSMAFGAHEEVGHGGHFLGAAHTMERFRTCFYRPMLSSSENYERWMRNGAKDTATRAGEIYKKKLAEYEQPPMDEAMREELEAYVVRRRAELGD